MYLLLVFFGNAVLIKAVVSMHWRSPLNVMRYMFYFLTDFTSLSDVPSSKQFENCRSSGGVKDLYNIKP